MFNQIQRLISEAGLSGVNFTVKPNDGTKLSVILSFALKDDLDPRLLQELVDNAGVAADSVVALRSALSVPLVVVCEPEEVESKLGAALAQLHDGVVDAATTYSATDISALISAASNTVKAKNAAAKTDAAKTPAKGKGKTVTKPEAATDSSNTDETVPEANDADQQNSDAADDAQDTAEQDSGKRSPAKPMSFDFDSL